LELNCCISSKLKATAKVMPEREDTANYDPAIDFAS
jgi:hypothetical protein